MLEKLRDLIGAKVAVFFLHDLPVNPTRVQLHAYMDVGSEPNWQRYISAGDMSPDPTTPYIMRMVGQTFTRTRDQMCSDKQWYGSSYVNEVRRRLGADDSLVSQVVLPQRAGFTNLGFGREFGDRPFGRREREAIHLFHTELVELWRTPRVGNGREV